MPKAPFAAADIYNFRWIDHVRLDPTGERAAYVVRRADREAVDYRSQVYVRGVGADDPVIQATAGQKDDSPEWAPDGRRLAYAGKKGNVSQVFVLDPGAGDSRQLTSLEFGAGAPRWSPDGRRIAFTVWNYDAQFWSIR